MFNWKGKDQEHITWMERREKVEEKLREHKVAVREQVGQRAKARGH